MLSGPRFENSITFPIVKEYVDEVYLVREQEIRHAVYLVWENEKQIVEGSAATAVALLVENKEMFLGKTVALVMSGGNIDDSRFQTVLTWERGS